MLEMYCVESNQLIEEMENIMLDAEENNNLESHIDEIFRIMHTIKGNSMMMMFDSIGNYAHSVEDLFDFIRKEKPKNINYSRLTDLVLELVDFVKQELEKIETTGKSDGISVEQIALVKEFLKSIKFMGDMPDTGEVVEEKPVGTDNQKYYISSLDTTTKNSSQETGAEQYYAIKVFFQKESQMENIRAFTLVHNLKDIAYDIVHFPADVVDTASIEMIQNEGFNIAFKTKVSFDEVKAFVDGIAFAEKAEFEELDIGEYENFKIDFRNIHTVKKEKIEKAMAETQMPVIEKIDKTDLKDKESDLGNKKKKQNYISVGVDKLDGLMDLVGELVVSEAMVTNNPELANIDLDNFYKAARQHRKIIKDLQDIVMSIRMVPLGPTFQKMNRIVRDISKKTDKQVSLEILGENTEVDKNVIEHISDPLMHLIRNAVDHGIESPEERLAANKNEHGTVTLEGKHAGGYVWIIVKDDGKGLDRIAIYNKAVDKGLADKPEEYYTDKEIYNFVLQPGFSTKTQVTEFSGRGVGMDVVVKNIEKIGGSISIDSELGKGSEMAIKIPLTLAIIDGMVLRVGPSRFIMPIASIRESFKLEKENYIKDPSENEMILVRGETLPLLRLKDRFHLSEGVDNIEDGIVVIVEHEDKTICLAADEIIGQQQVVVKSLSSYMKNVEGISGGALLGDGSISLILDPSGLTEI